jgi:heme exporter protein B
MTNHFRTELLLHLRQSQAWLYPIAFFVIIVSLFPLAFSPDPTFLQKYMPGCVWIAALLASLLSIETIFVSDLEDGYVEQVVLNRSSLTAVIMAKLAAQWVVSELPLILLTPVLGFMFGLSNWVIVSVCLSLLLGTPILLLVGCLSVALTIGLKQQGALLGVMMLPLVTPVLIFGVNISQQAQAGFSIGGPMAFLAGLCVLAVTLLPWAIGAALRVGLDD